MAKKPKFYKGELITYAVRELRVLAIVRRVHRDGTVTVEARHVLDKNGNPFSGYFGYRSTFPASYLRLAAEINL